MRRTFDKDAAGRELDCDAWMRGDSCGPQERACIQAAANCCAVNMMLVNKDPSEPIECVATTATNETLHLAVVDAGGETRWRDRVQLR